MFTDKTTQSVADAVKKIMEADAQKKVEEALIGAQKNIDKNHNNKIDAQDFKILKGQKKAVKTEEVVKEEVQQLNEVKLADLPVRKIEGKSYGKNYVDPEGADDAADMKSKKKVSKGTYASRATRGFETPAAKAKRDAKIAMRKESFTDLLNSYQENGIKGLFESLEKIEEDSTEEVKKQLDDAQAKSEGKKTQPDLSKGSVQAVKSESVEEEVEQIDERTLTASETDKKEEIVKSMKKGLAGFKERYGKDAKSVMYATSTKIAKDKA